MKPDRHFFYPGQAKAVMLTFLQPYVEDADYNLNRLEFLRAVRDRVANDLDAAEATVNRMKEAA